MASVNAVIVLEYMRELSRAHHAATGQKLASNTDLAEFLAIAFAENFGTRVVQDLVDDKSNTSGNTPPSTDRGMWMINSYWWSHVTDECAYDWRCATKAVSERTQGFTTNKTQWSVYKNGNYLVHLPIAWVFIRLMLARDREKDALADVAVLKDSVTQRESLISELQTKITMLEDGDSAARDRIAQLEAEKSQLENEIANLKIKVSAAVATLTS